MIYLFSTLAYDDHHAVCANCANGNESFRIAGIIAGLSGDVQILYDLGFFKP